MPDSTINAESSGNADDVMHYKTSTSDWATVRGDASTTSAGFSVDSSAHSLGVYNRKSSGRGGTTWYCYRSYFSSDVSGESGTVDSATIKIYVDNFGSSGDASKVALVEATALEGSTFDDFGNCFSSGSTLGTLVAPAVSVSTTSSYHDFVLNSDGITALNNQIGSGQFQVCLMGHEFDYSDTDPGSGSTYTRIKVWYSESGLTPPKVEIDYEAVAVTNNATFFGSNF